MMFEVEPGFEVHAAAWSNGTIDENSPTVVVVGSGRADDKPTAVGDWVVRTGTRYVRFEPMGQTLGWRWGLDRSRNRRSAATGERRSWLSP